MLELNINHARQILSASLAWIKKVFWHNRIIKAFWRLYRQVWPRIQSCKHVMDVIGGARRSNAVLGSSVNRANAPKTSTSCATSCTMQKQKKSVEQLTIEHPHNQARRVSQWSVEQNPEPLYKETWRHAKRKKTFAQMKQTTLHTENARTKSSLCPFCRLTNSSRRYLPESCWSLSWHNRSMAKSHVVYVALVARIVIVSDAIAIGLEAITSN